MSGSRRSEGLADEADSRRPGTLIRLTASSQLTRLRVRGSGSRDKDNEA